MLALLAPLVDADAFPVVPLKAEVDASTTTLKALLASLDRTTSAYGDDAAEGVYVRLEDDDVVIDRWKLRRDTFSAGRTDFATNVVTNSLRS